MCDLDFDVIHGQDNFRLTCLSAQQQRAKNETSRQPRKVHWDYLLDEAEWLRRDFREERVWKMDEAKKRAGECLEAWRLRIKERGRFVEVEGDAHGVTGLGLGYRREGVCHGEAGTGRAFTARTGSPGEDSGGGVLGKRHWSVTEDGGVDVQDRSKRPRTLRRFSCHVGDST
jgi:hypothetical protein